MPDCRLCPRRCGADRAVSAGVCHMGSAVRVARAAPHYGEEPCISGERGSGAVFFAGCPLGCVYCQNYALSRGRIGETVSVERLAAIFAGLEAKGVHNLNLVTGTQFTPEIREALTIAKPKIPVVWNTSGYETVGTVDALAESVSVFLPDLKYTDPALAARYSRAPDYPAAAKSAIKRMVEHTGAFELDENGLLRRGVMIRHLVLPGQIENTRAALFWIADTFAPGTVLVRSIPPAGISKNSRSCAGRSRRRNGTPRSRRWTRPASRTGMCRSSPPPARKKFPPLTARASYPEFPAHILSL